MFGNDNEPVESLTLDGGRRSLLHGRPRASAVPVTVTCQGQAVVAVVDHVRAVATPRLRTKMETATPTTVRAVADALNRILELP
ncbi:MAG: hypothetical protein HOP18_09225 [Deltaproteobacteria bacterium]|nr:hypothetical protein [Deltaproteobacteria bacterium]